jgi:urease accessory protein
VKACLVLQVADGAVRRLTVDPPLTVKIRPRRGSAVEVWLVGSAAALLEDDQLAMEIDVGPGCELVVRSVASTVAHPCPAERWVTTRTRARVAAGASLWWAPEPVIVAEGARYRYRNEVEVGAGASCVWREEVVLGRSGEDPGRIELEGSLCIDVEGRPLVRDGLCSAAGWRGPAVVGGARYVGALHLANRPVVPTRPVGTADDRWFQLAGPGLSCRVLADDPLDGRRRLDDAERQVGDPSLIGCGPPLAHPVPPPLDRAAVPGGMMSS